MRESAGVESAGADFGKEVCAEHFASIDEINGRCDMAGVAMLGLDLGELRGEFGREDEREVFSCIVAYGLGDEVGEGHGIAVARAVMRVDTRLFKTVRLKEFPKE